MSLKELVVGTVVTVVIGGTVYTVSQADVVQNFASDTGLTQQQAEDYVKSVDEDDLVPYDKLGSDYISDGQMLLNNAQQIDCASYEYQWESSALTCEAGKAQLNEIGGDEIALGQAYKKLDTNSVSKTDISLAISLIDEVNSDYELGIVGKLLDRAAIDETKKANSYNKAVLKATLEQD